MEKIRTSVPIVHNEIDNSFYQFVADDYEHFMKNIRLATTQRQKELLSAQSIHGHAMNGDVCFSRVVNGDKVSHMYVNCSVPDVYKAIIASNPRYAKELDDIKIERYVLVKELQGWINEAVSYVMRNKPFSKYNPRRLVDSKGNPLMGIELFMHTAISDPKSVLIGLYLGSCMDSAYWREQTRDFFRSKGIDFSMHRGLCTAGNLEKITDAGFTISDLSHMAENDFYKSKGEILSLEVLKQKGMVVDFSKLSRNEQKNGVPNKHPYVPIYVELSKGYGSSDDASFTYAGLINGIDAALGLILMDAVDTIDKCLPRIKENGEDECLGDYILRSFGGGKNNISPLARYLGIDEQDIVNLIFAAAIDKDHPNVWPSCSQRRFLQVDERGNYALMSHIDFIRHVSDGGPFPDNIKLSIKDIPSHSFYPAFKEKLRYMNCHGFIDMQKVRYQDRLSNFLE